MHGQKNIKFVRSVRPSVSPHGTIWLPLDGFSWNWCWKIFWKSVDKIQVSLKSDKNNWHFTWRPIYIFHNISLNSSYDKIKVLKKIKTHILCSIPPPRKSWLVWDSRKKYGKAGQATDDNITRRIRIACWVTKATNTHTEYSILIAFPLQQWLRERASVLYVYRLSCLMCRLIRYCFILVYVCTGMWRHVVRVHRSHRVNGNVGGNNSSQIETLPRHLPRPTDEKYRRTSGQHSYDVHNNCLQSHDPFIT